jgi:hypothetical protein
VIGIGGDTTLYFPEVGKPELPPPPARRCIELIGGVLKTGSQGWQAIPMKMVLESFPLGERVRLLKKLTMNSRLPK